LLDVGPALRCRLYGWNLRQLVASMRAMFMQFHCFVTKVIWLRGLAIGTGDGDSHWRSITTEWCASTRQAHAIESRWSNRGARQRRSELS